MVPRLAPAAEGPPALLVTLAGRPQWLQPGEVAATPDGALAVVLGDQRPAPPPGYPTAVLVSAQERVAVVHRADGDAVQPLTPGLALLGGAVRIDELLPHATRTSVYQTRSREWRNPAVVFETELNGRPSETLSLASQPRGVFLRDGRAALVFEKRDKEVKAFLSHVTAREGTRQERAVIFVKQPFEFGGWTLYQVNFNPDDPTYSGLEAVRDPGVLWVFAGFALICVGVFYMLYVEPRLRGGGIERPAPPGAGRFALREVARAPVPRRRAPLLRPHRAPLPLLHPGLRGGLGLGEPPARAGRHRADGGGAGAQHRGHRRALGGGRPGPLQVALRVAGLLRLLHRPALRSSSGSTGPGSSG